MVSSDAGLYGRWLVGKKVACHAPEDGHGTWAEYMAAPASDVIPLCKDVSLEQGASFVVNPLTAWALLSIARKEGHSAFIADRGRRRIGQDDGAPGSPVEHTVD